MVNPILALKQLESLRCEFDSVSAQKKKAHLEVLKTAQLRSPEQVTRLHELLCFMQAWPDDEAILSLVDKMLSRFQKRRDLIRHADKLINTGIAGTRIIFRFYADTALWLADHWPDHLHIDWDEFENAEKLEDYLSLLVSYSEAAGIDTIAMELPECIDYFKGPLETDALFVIKRLKALFSNEFLHEQFCDDLDIPLILSPGLGVPSRTVAKCDHAPIHYQSQPLVRTRPVVADEIQLPLEPPKRVGHAGGMRFVDMARCAMVTRQRDLDAFSYADANDVSVLGDGDLQFVLLGVLPERRFLLETLYGFLVLKNGVPISYGAITCLFNSAEVAYTILDSFRGGESARIYVRTLAMVYHVFGCDTFTITPYQLGEENDDALKSGAWWFYQKLGYRPRNKKLLKLMEQEISTIKRLPKHRSTLTVLKQLATDNLILDLKIQRDDVLGRLDLARVGLKITKLFAHRFGWNREQGEESLAAEAASNLGVTSFQGWSAGERLAWQRWSPIVALIDNLQRWPSADQEALVRLIRAKGGRQELDFLRGFDSHGRLRKAIVKMTA